MSQVGVFLGVVVLANPILFAAALVWAHFRAPSTAGS